MRFKTLALLLPALFSALPADAALLRLPAAEGYAVILPGALPEIKVTPMYLPGAIVDAVMLPRPLPAALNPAILPAALPAPLIPVNVAARVFVAGPVFVAAPIEARPAAALHALRDLSALPPARFL